MHSVAKCSRDECNYSVCVAYSQCITFVAKLVKFSPSICSVVIFCVYRYSIEVVIMMGL